MRDVPPELLELIFKSLDKPALKNVRVVCKKFNQIVIPHFFEKVVITSNPLKVARLVATHFGLVVRTLVGGFWSTSRRV